MKYAYLEVPDGAGGVGGYELYTVSVDAELTFAGSIEPPAFEDIFTALMDAYGALRG